MIDLELALKLAFDISRYIADRISEVNWEEWGRPVGKNPYGTTTKLVDKIAEEAAFYIIDEYDPELNVLSEETGFLDRGYKECLILDPLDGTNNAINGIPFYGVSIAIGSKTLGDVYFGYVYNVVSADEFYAFKGRGVYWNNQKVTRPLKTDMKVIYLGKHAREIRNELGEQVNDELYSGKLRSLGAAALELALVSVGALRYYFQPAERLRVVDIAAGAFLVWENGGIVVNRFCKSLKDLPISLDVRTSVFASLEGKMLIC